MSNNPNQQITVFFIAVLLIVLFFSVFAFLFLGDSGKAFHLPGAQVSRDDLEEPFTTSRTRGDASVFKPLKSTVVPSIYRGKYIPQTLAEKAYFSADTKIRTMKQRSAAKRQSQTVISEFFKSPLGQNLKATFELAKRGQTQSAKQFISRILEDLVEMDPLIQRYVLQSAISVYAHDNDKKGLSSMLTKYLEFTDENDIGDKDERRDLIAGVRRKIGELGD